MIGLAQSNRVSRATCVPMPCTKTTPVRRAPPGAAAGDRALARLFAWRRRRLDSGWERRRLVGHTVTVARRHLDRVAILLQRPRTTMAPMYLDAMEFLEEEREAWRPYEALLELDRPTTGAPGRCRARLVGA